MSPEEVYLPNGMAWDEAKGVVYFADSGEETVVEYQADDKVNPRGRAAVILVGTERFYHTRPTDKAGQGPELASFQRSRCPPSGFGAPGRRRRFSTSAVYLLQEPACFSPALLLAAGWAACCCFPSQPGSSCAGQGRAGSIAEVFKPQAFISSHHLSRQTFLVRPHLCLQGIMKRGPDGKLLARPVSHIPTNHANVPDGITIDTGRFGLAVACSQEQACCPDTASFQPCNCNEPCAERCATEDGRLAAAGSLPAGRRLASAAVSTCAAVPKLAPICNSRAAALHPLPM